jgi:hypothetical protein
LQHVHAYALEKLLQERRKAPAKGSPPPSCTCSNSTVLRPPLLPHNLEKTTRERYNPARRYTSTLVYY